MKKEELKEGNSFKAIIPTAQRIGKREGFRPEPMEIHISYILKSKAYTDSVLIVYMVCGTAEGYMCWHEYMCEDWEMIEYIELSKKYYSEQKGTNND